MPLSNPLVVVCPSIGSAEVLSLGEGGSARGSWGGGVGEPVPPVGRSVEEALRLVNAFQFVEKHGGQGGTRESRGGGRPLRPRAVYLKV